jgi:hypothetical protein
MRVGADGKADSVMTAAADSGVPQLQRPTCVYAAACTHVVVVAAAHPQTHTQQGIPELQQLIAYTAADVAEYACGRCDARRCCLVPKAWVELGVHHAHGHT